MKRTYLAKRNALLSSTNFSWGAGALVCAVLILLVRLLAPNFFWHAFAPVFKSADAFAVKSHAFFNSFSDTATLAAKNEQLANENAALANENHMLLQNSASLSLLGKEVKGISAGVVARPPESPYDTLVIAKGLNDGMTLGMEAFGEGGVPIGVVSSVLTNFSRVTLFSASNVLTNGWIGHASLPLTIRGAGAGVMQASLSRSAGVAVGDIVFAPGPGMLPIGRVVRVDSDPSTPGVTLRIMPTLNLFSITWVVVRDTGMTPP